MGIRREWVVIKPTPSQARCGKVQVKRMVHPHLLKQRFKKDLIFHFFNSDLRRLAPPLHHLPHCVLCFVLFFFCGFLKIKLFYNFTFELGRTT